MKCNVCGKDDWFYEQSLGFTCTNCGSFRIDKRQTNADRIRAMSDEELAKVVDICMLPDEFLGDKYMALPAIEVILQWLKQEVE